ncbi:MAG: hypothetical protein ACFCU6_09820 [Balneolaceae bacterium]
MAKSNITTLLFGVVLLLGTVACGPSLVIQNVDYAQPIESVLSPDSDNIVHDQRYAVKFSVSPILEEEGTGAVDHVRLIRNRAGFYFVTASGFQNVYIFEPSENELKLKRKIEITTAGLGQPAFNQRQDHIELIDSATGDTFRLTEEGRL